MVLGFSDSMGATGLLGAGLVCVTLMGEEKVDVSVR
jgi:hypothetical protein